MSGKVTLKFATAFPAASLMNLDLFCIAPPNGLSVSFADS